MEIFTQIDSWHKHANLIVDSVDSVDSIDSVDSVDCGRPLPSASFGRGTWQRRIYRNAFAGAPWCSVGSMCSALLTASSGRGGTCWNLQDPCEAGVDVDVKTRYQHKECSLKSVRKVLEELYRTVTFCAGT